MKILALLALFWAAPLLAQNCTSTLVDNARVLQGREQPLLQAASDLVNVGADPRIVTDQSSDTPERYVEQIRQTCLAWQSGSGGVKNNLIVFLVFPGRHKMAVFTGREYAAYLQADTLKTEYMKPAFQDRDYARGMLHAVQQATIRIKAHQQAALHPAVTHIDAPSYSGLWVVMGWVVGLAALGGLIWLIYGLWNRHLLKLSVQQAAAEAKNDAAKRVLQVREWLDTKKALGVDVAQAESLYNLASEDFTRISSLEAFNPERADLSADQYKVIADRYRSIWQDLGMVRSASAPASPGRPKARNYTSRSESMQSAASPATTTVINNSTTVVGGYDYPIMPVVVIEDNSYTPQYVHTESAPATQSDSWSGSSSSYSSDGDSSFSSDSSSSDYSSGGDSGDSGGGDSGGGDSF